MIPPGGHCGGPGEKKCDSKEHDGPGGHGTCIKSAFENAHGSADSFAAGNSKSLVKEGGGKTVIEKEQNKAAGDQHSVEREAGTLHKCGNSLTATHEKAGESGSNLATQSEKSKVVSAPNVLKVASSNAKSQQSQLETHSDKEEVKKDCKGSVVKTESANTQSNHQSFAVNSQSATIKKAGCH